MADNLSYEDFKNIVDSYVVKNLSSPLVVSLPPGSWNPSIWPLDQLNVSDNPACILCDVVFGLGGAIDWADLEGKYKQACQCQDLQLLPEPFGHKQKLPAGTKLQFAVYPLADGTHTIIKHFFFQNKCKPSVFMQHGFGDSFRFRFMATNPRVGRKDLPACLRQPRRQTIQGLRARSLCFAEGFHHTFRGTDG